MPRALFKFFGILAALATVFFLYFLTRNLLFPTAAVALHEFFVPHLLFSTFRDLLEFFIPLFLSTLAIAFAFWIKPAELPKQAEGGIDGHKTLNLALIPIILALFFNTFLVFGLKPALYNQLQDWERRATEETQLLSKLNGLHNRDLLKNQLVFPQKKTQSFSPLASLVPTEEKIAIMERLVAIRPGEMAYQFRLRLLQSQKLAEDFVNSRRLPLPEGWYLQSFTGLTPADLLKQARTYFNNDDFANANFRAFLAFQMLTNLQQLQPAEFEKTGQADLELAKTLIDETWTASSEMELTVNEKNRASYFFRKGKSMGDFQFQNYLEAYYGFLELAHENIKDPETEKFLALAKAKLRERVLFKEEVERYFAIPGYKNLVFLKPIEVGAAYGVREVMSIGALVETTTGVYLKDIQALRFDASGAVLFHWRAEFGKLDKDRLNLEVRSLNLPGDDFLPRIIVNNSNGLLKSAPLSWPMQIPLGNLKVLANADGRFSSLGLMELLDRGETLADLGYSNVPVKTEFVARVLNSVFLLVLAFFGMFIAWTFRSKYLAYPPRILQAFLLFLPFVISFLLNALQWILSLAVGALIQSFDWGFVGALVILGGLAVPMVGIFAYLSWRVMSK